MENPNLLNDWEKEYLADVLVVYENGAIEGIRNRADVIDVFRMIKLRKKLKRILGLK